MHRIQFTLRVGHNHSAACRTKARFKRRILHAPNAIQTMHNEEAYLIIYCLNCIRCMQNSTFETGLKHNGLAPLMHVCLAQYGVMVKTCMSTMKSRNH